MYLSSLMICKEKMKPWGVGTVKNSLNNINYLKMSTFYLERLGKINPKIQDARGHLGELRLVFYH